MLFAAAVTATCCKRKEFWSVDTDDIDFDEVEPDLEMDEEWQHLGEFFLEVFSYVFLLVTQI